MKVSYATLALLSSALIVPISAAGKPHLVSGAVDHPIVVDGSEGDWTGALQPFGNQPFSVQAENDGTFLYLHLDASSPAVRREILRTGMTIWFDPKGNTKKAFGIRYPVVEEPFDQGGRGEYGRGGSGRRRFEGRGRPAIGSDETEPADRVDILGPGKRDARSLTREHLDGVEVAVRVNGDELVYELKVPLAQTSDHPYAINATPGQTIGIGFETPKVSAPQFHNRGGFGGGFGGRRREPRGGEDYGKARDRFQQPKPLKAWGTLTLR